MPFFSWSQLKNKFFLFFTNIFHYTWSVAKIPQPCPLRSMFGGQTCHLSWRVRSEGKKGRLICNHDCSEVKGLNKTALSVFFQTGNIGESFFYSHFEKPYSYIPCPLYVLHGWPTFSGHRTHHLCVSWDASGHWPETLGESISCLFFCTASSCRCCHFFFVSSVFLRASFKPQSSLCWVSRSWRCEARGCYATVNKIMSRTHYCLCLVGLLCEVPLRAAGFSLEGRVWRETRNHISFISFLQRVP